MSWTCAIVTLVISVLHIISHLRAYACPPQQRLIVRIASVIPIYALTSALSFGFPNQVLYFAAIRDAAEAFVIYNFLNRDFKHFNYNEVGVRFLDILKFDIKFLHMFSRLCSCPFICLPSSL